MARFATLTHARRTLRIVDLPALAGDRLARLPWICRIVIENLVRRSGGDGFAMDIVEDWLARGWSDEEISFHPTRVLMHDTTCGPALVDIAACRDVLAEAGGDPARLAPVLPVDISTDHSLAVDVFGVPGARDANRAREMARNGERYRFMKWATLAMPGVRAHPPGVGIMHTINLERLATVVGTGTGEGGLWAFPDTLIGTDSHTPMVNGLGVLAWGVGGLEAESVLFGMPVTLRAPEVVGVRLTGRLNEGVLATDLALALAERLRRLELSDRFLEFFGPGVSTLSAGERAVVANMAPEYGSTSAYFPIDGSVLAYLATTGRSAGQVTLVEAYARRTGLWFDPDGRPSYAEALSFDLGSVASALAGPRRPQDRVALDGARAALGAPEPAGGLPAAPVVVAAITSCTNTSDPRLLLAAGLLARKARRLGLSPPSWVKTSLAPGSPTAERYLARAGLLEDLDALGFSIVGYGCTTCIGNSGPLTDQARAAMAAGARPVAVLSGNRNFPGRVHAELDQAFLASPPLVVAAALAGDLDRDLLRDPIGRTDAGRPVMLAELWPSGEEIDAAFAQAWRVEDVALAYEAAEASADWAQLSAPDQPLFPWDERSTYLRRPPFVRMDAPSRLGRYLAHPILVVGDDVTTDHISPAGAIPADSEAGAWLIERGERADDLNVFSSRRGNWEVMLRGLFTSRSVRNLLAEGVPPGATVHAPSGRVLPLWRAAELYRAEAQPVVLVAGERYGMGSSRDWAAKGVALLGVRAVLAAGFERIHRSNLVNMGVLPLRLPDGRGPDALRLRPGDRLEIEAETLSLRAEIPVAVRRRDNGVERFTARAAVETSLEIEILNAGGMLPKILREARAASEASDP